MNEPPDIVSYIAMFFYIIMVLTFWIAIFSLIGRAMSNMSKKKKKFKVAPPMKVIPLPLPQDQALYEPGAR